MVGAVVVLVVVVRFVVRVVVVLSGFVVVVRVVVVLGVVVLVVGIVVVVRVVVVGIVEVVTAFAASNRGMKFGDGIDAKVKRLSVLVSMEDETGLELVVVGTVGKTVAALLGMVVNVFKAIGVVTVVLGAGDGETGRILVSFRGKCPSPKPAIAPIKRTDMSFAMSTGR